MKILIFLIFLLLPVVCLADSDSLVTIGKEKIITDQISVMCLNGYLWKAKQINNGEMRTFKLAEDDGTFIQCGDKPKDTAKKKTNKLSDSFDEMEKNLEKSQTVAIVPRFSMMCINGKLVVNIQYSSGAKDNYMVEYEGAPATCGKTL